MHWFTRLAAGAAFALGCALAGCGSTSLTASGSGTSSPPTSAITPTRALNGCPAQQVPVDGFPRADVLVTGQNEAFNQPVALHKGQILEVRLQAGIYWHLAANNSQQALANLGLAGWYNDAQKACIWEYTASAAGTATLNFSGGLVCLPNTACPAIAAAQTYTVTVR
jgi:hypothetical protein